MTVRVHLRLHLLLSLKEETSLSELKIILEWYGQGKDFGGIMDLTKKTMMHTLIFAIPQHSCPIQSMQVSIPQTFLTTNRQWTVYIRPHKSA